MFGGLVQDSKRDSVVVWADHCAGGVKGPPQQYLTRSKGGLNPKINIHTEAMDLPITIVLSGGD